jgi:hypothetical protein
MDHADMEKCYEYFDCSKLDCVRRKEEDKECWEIDETLCNSHSRIVDIMKNELGSKILACEQCIYYQQHYKIISKKKINSSNFKQKKR